MSEADIFTATSFEMEDLDEEVSCPSCGSTRVKRWKNGHCHCLECGKKWKPST